MRTQGRIRSLHSLERRIEDEARAEAERQARRVPWLTLLEYRKQHIEWEAFTLWAHAIEEAEHRAPGWLCRMVEGSCPGIKLSKGTKLWKCMDTWKQKTIFAKPISGRLDARSQLLCRAGLGILTELGILGVLRAGIGQSGARLPIRPLRNGSQPRTTVLTKSWIRVDCARSERNWSKRLGAEAENGWRRAVGKYLEIEAFAYWLRPILDARLPLPGGVRDEIKNRYPFLEVCDEWNRDQMWDCLKKLTFSSGSG